MPTAKADYGNISEVIVSYCAHVILYPLIFFIRFLKRMNLKQDKSSTCSKITVLCELSLVLYDSSSNNIKKVCAQFFSSKGLV